MRCVEQEIKDRAALIESLEQTEVFYDAQYGEAKIVANVRLIVHVLIIIFNFGRLGQHRTFKQDSEL